MDSNELSNLYKSRPFARKLLEHFYRVYNPDRIGSIDNILDNYASHEPEMFLHLCEKYEVGESEFNGFIEAVKRDKSLVSLSCQNVLQDEV